MGEGQGWLFEPSFNRAVKVREADPRISDNAGAVLLREIDHRLGLTADLAAALSDPRDPERSRYTQAELLRQHLYVLALGHAHQSDHDTLAHDPAMRLGVWDRPGQRVDDERLASQPSDWRLIERLSGNRDRQALRTGLGESVVRHQRAAGNGRKAMLGTLDIDPFPIELHGRQTGGAYHGYYSKRIYHPIVAGFSAEGSYEADRLGDGFVHAMLRRGNCGGAEGAERFLRHAIAKGHELAVHLDVRLDAGLVNGDTLETIDGEGARFVGRLRSNAALDRLAAPYLRREPGRPSAAGDEFAIDLGPYRAESWSQPWRLILVVIDLPDPKTGMRDLIPHHFFLITNWPAERRSAWELVEHYRKRGTFEDRLGEFNGVIGQGLPARSFEANEAALLLKLLAFNLAGMVRGELEHASGNGWGLQRVQRTVLKTGARLVRHAGRLVLDVSRAAGKLWRRVLERVRRWWRDEAWGRDGLGRPRGPRARRWVPPPAHAHRCLVLRE